MCEAVWRRLDLPYDDAIADCIASGKPATFGNTNEKHARSLIRHIFRESREEVVIVACELSATVYGDPSVYPEIASFLQRPGSRLRILLEQDIASDNVVRSILEEYLDGRDPKVELVVANRELGAHYVVGDMNQFRFESDPKKCSAAGGFNQKRAEPNLAEIAYNQVARLFAENGMRQHLNAA